MIATKTPSEHEGVPLGVRQWHRFFMCLTSVAIACLICACGCGESPDETATVKSVYIDLPTKQVIVADPTGLYPAIHPSTGMATLMPAMYCGSCDAWRQVPLPDQINHLSGPLTCVKCKRGLSIDGPVPNQTVGDPPK